jgi:hypothetical protein
MTGMEYEETVKKWKLREKVGGFHFLFSANCAILFNGNLSKPLAQTSGLAAGPALTGKRSRAQPMGAVEGGTFLPAGFFAGREQTAGGLTLVR